MKVGCGTVVGGEKDALLATAQDENVICPREDLGAAPESLSGSCSTALSRVVDDEDGALEAALQAAQAVEDGRDLADGVLVGAVEADEGVEDEQAGSDALDGLGEALEVGGIVESEGGSVDDVEVEAGERGAAGGCDAVETLAEDVGGVLGGKQQHRSGPGREALEAGDAGGDGDGDVKSEERLATLGLAADDADALRAPERFDEPGLLFGAGLELAGGAGGEADHVRGPPRLAAWGKTSK